MGKVSLNIENKRMNGICSPTMQVVVKTLKLVNYRCLQSTSKKCAKVRATRAARLCFYIQPILLLTVVGEATVYIILLLRCIKCRKHALCTYTF